MDKHHDDGGGVAGANLGGVASANRGGVAGDNEEARLLVSDKPNQPDPQVIHHRKQSHRNSDQHNHRSV